MARCKRDNKREAFWRKMLGRQRESGLSVRAFCRREKLSEPSFYAWRRIVRERDKERQPTQKRQPARPGFVPVVIREDPARADHAVSMGGGIVIEWQGGRRMSVTPEIVPERLAALVRALEQSPEPEALQ